MAAAVLGSAFQENFSNGGFQSLDELDLQPITNGKPYQTFSDFRYPSDEAKRPHLYNPQSPSPPKRTPPKKHRSVTDPQTFIDEAKLEAKLSRPRPTQRRKERAKVLSGLSAHQLVEKLVYEEFDAQESRRLLKDAMSRLDAAEKRATQAEAEKRAIEMGQAVQGLKVMQNVIDNQGEITKTKQDLAVCQYQLQNAQREIEREKYKVRQLERQRDDAEAAANSARSVARDADSQRILAMMQADTQKRWLEENLRSLTAAANKRKHRHSHSPSASSVHDNRRETIHDASGTQQNDFRQVLETYKRELMDSYRRESEQRESARRLELERMEDERKHERERARQKEQEMENEREQMRRRDKERNADVQREFDKYSEMEAKFRREKANFEDREAELKRERNRARDRIQDLEREVQDLKRQLEAEREKVIKAEKAASQRPPGTLPRVLMPPPPNPNLVPRLPSPPLQRPPPAAEIIPPPPAPAALVVPPPGQLSQPQPTTAPMFPPQQIQPNPYAGRGGRAGTGTPESGVSTITVQSARDILTFGDDRGPGQRRDLNQPPTLQRQLSAISEVSDVPTASPSRASNSNASPSPGPPVAPPNWFSNPPVDFLSKSQSKSQSIDQWRRSTSDAVATEPSSPDNFSDTYSPPRRREGRQMLEVDDPRRLSNRSSGSFNINVEPPSAPASSSGGQDHENERMGFLSPNSAHAAPLPRVQEPPQPQRSAPVIPPPSMSFGAPPPGFVMQSFTPSSNSMTIPPPPIIPSSPSTRPVIMPSSAGQPVIPPPPVIPPSSSSSIYSGWGGPPTGSSTQTQTPTPNTGSSWRPPSAQSIYSSGTAGGRGGEPRSLYQPFPSPSGRQSVPPGVASTSSSSGSTHTPRSLYAPAGPTAQPPQGILKRTGATTPVIPPGPGGSRTPSSIYAGLPQATGMTPRQGYSDFHDHEDDEHDDLDPVTRRNTDLNSFRRVDTQTPTPALPIPPPSFPRGPS